MKAEYYQQQLDLVHKRVQKALLRQFQRVVIATRRSNASLAKWNPESLALHSKDGQFSSFDRNVNDGRLSSYNKIKGEIGLDHDKTFVKLDKLPASDLIQVLRILEAMELYIAKS